MKIASLQEIKTELDTFSPKDVKQLCLRLARFKKENKELLTYLLFEAHDNDTYVSQVKAEVDEAFLDLPKANLYLTKKSLRKLLRSLAKYIRHISASEAEIEILLYFVSTLKNSGIPYRRTAALKNLYDGQVKKIQKAISSVHEDLQFDYQKKLDVLNEN